MLHSYPWYIKDWLLSEARLTMTLEERGLYRDMLDMFFDQGSLPADERALFRMAACETHEFKRAWPVVRKKFTERDGRLYNQKAEEVLSKKLATREIRASIGRLGGLAKQKQMESKQPSKQPSKPEAIATNLLEQTVPARARSPSPSPSPSPVSPLTPQSKNEAKREQDCADFPLGGPFDRWREIFSGPIEDSAWRQFGLSVNTPELVDAILSNTPLWMKTKRYRDGFTGAVSFLRSGVWKRPPKSESSPNGLTRAQEMLNRLAAKGDGQ